MILEVIREAWATSPAKVLAALVLTPLVCVLIWVLLVLVTA